MAGLGSLNLEAFKGQDEGATVTAVVVATAIESTHSEQTVNNSERCRLILLDALPGGPPG